MKMLIISILLLLSLFLRQRPYQVCIIAFYNLENFYDTVDNPIVNDDDFTPRGIKHYDGTIFRDKVNKLATVISQIGTDISINGPALLGVAEIENDTVLETLVRHPLLKNRQYRIIHFDSKDARGVDVGLLYQPAYFVPEKAAKLFVALPGNSKDAFFTRDILYVQGRLAGETIHVYVNHWPSRRGGEARSRPAREAAAKVCIEHAAGIFDTAPNARIVLMGDLNDDPDNRSITHVIGAKGKPSEVKTGGWFNPWLEPYRKGIGTLANRDSWGLFDQILLSHAWLDTMQPGLRFHHAGIFARDFMKEDHGPFKNYPMRTWEGNIYRGGYSDHFPTFVVLVRKTNVIM
jgi:hypothetical protein